MLEVEPVCGVSVAGWGLNGLGWAPTIIFHGQRGPKRKRLPGARYEQTEEERRRT